VKIGYYKIKIKHCQLKLLVISNCEYGLQQVNNNIYIVHTKNWT